MMPFEEWRDQQCAGYPRPPGKYRFDVELRAPFPRLSSVPVEHNPHAGGCYGPHTCFYSCDDWSTLFGVHEVAGQADTLRMVVECGNPEPLWGERVRLMSTAAGIQDDPWDTVTPNRFAVFRGLYWRVSSLEALQPWSPGSLYPLTRFAGPLRIHPLGLPPDLLYNENVDPRRSGMVTQRIAHRELHEGCVACYRPHASTQQIQLGDDLMLVVWEHQDEVTGSMRFLSISPGFHLGFPEAFLNTKDREMGTIRVLCAGCPEYLVQRVASGVETERYLHFRLLNQMITQPVQPQQERRRSGV